jgi:ligand-binding sensor domain-containing protein
MGSVRRFDERRSELKKYPQIEQRPPVLLYEDKRGRIWVGDHAGELMVYDKTTNSCVQYNLADKIIHKNHNKGLFHLSTIYQDKQGQMLFGLNRGLLSYKEAQQKWKLLSLREIGLDDDIEHILEDKTGRIWITSRSGIAVLEQ